MNGAVNVFYLGIGCAMNLPMALWCYHRVPNPPASFWAFYGTFRGRDIVAQILFWPWAAWVLATWRWRHW